jgi:hypothetical protein
MMTGVPQTDVLDMNEMMFTFWADRLGNLRNEDRRLDAMMDLQYLETALRDPAAVDLYGLATLYKARLLRRQGATQDEVLDAVLEVIDGVMALSTAG